ncbi:Golgi SNAP receptor complex [Echinococcus multilocularis]|uniref:Golgi SNAP receptor complex member 1 n=1 Tax=Echinococcus multilocularis TaxID=6211 RepID=A0A068Y3J4_ECHMU|nr:Golgi SNAP receptor complex [Echinococcus multilocularis]
MQWSELRRQAKALESELDLKLTEFGKVGSSSLSGSVVTRTPHITQSSSSQSYSDLCNDIEGLLQRLTQVNDKMGDVVSGADHGNISQQHIAKRHREILFDYSQDFKRMRTNFNNARNRDYLLSSTYRSQNDLRSQGDKPPEATRLLIEEQKSLLHTDKMLTDRLSAASAIRSALKSQHHMLKATTGNLLNLRAQFPLVNKVLNQVSWRKKRDSIIVGSVIGCCLLFLLFYLFH